MTKFYSNETCFQKKNLKTAQKIVLKKKNSPKIAEIAPK